MNKKERVSAERLKELLHYDPLSGAFVWKARTRGRIKGGCVAGTMDQGYVHIKVDGRKYLSHRLAWLWMRGVWPVDQIDHINGIRSDNRFSNLREVSQSANLQNQQRAQSHNKSSGLLGVSWHKGRGKWVAQIQINGAKRHIGLFPTAEHAHAAYLSAKREHHPTCTI